MRNGKKMVSDFFHKPVITACGKLSFLFFLIVKLNFAAAQEVPLGQWDTHFNYQSARHVVSTGNRIFSSSYNGLFSINPEDKKIKILSKEDGLSETGINSFAYDQEYRTMLLAYRSGNMDLLYLNDQSEPEQIIPWHVFTNTSGLPDNKQINRILFQKSVAYLATNFGIVVLNTKLQQVGETYRYIATNGAEANVKDIAFSSDSIYALTSTGILASSMSATVNRQFFGNWKLLSVPFTATAIVSHNNLIYAGFPGKGVYQLANGSWILIYPSISFYYSFYSSTEGLIVTLENSVVSIPANGSPGVFRSSLFLSPKESIVTSADKIWTADNKNGLVSNTEGDFKIFLPEQKDTTLFPRTDSSIVAPDGLTWTHLPSYLGGGISVKNPQTNQERFLTTATNNGGLPSSTVNSLAVDQDGYIWFAGDKGVGYFLPDEILTNSRVNAVLPVFGQRRLFSNEKCTALAIEPGNRKWIGTLNGIYLFNADGTEMISQFTAEESPLPSNAVTSLRFAPETGMLFVDTPNGMVSYRSNSTSSAENFSSVTIFPNPVRPGYGGQIGFKGLMEKSTVKVMQLSGRLVYETKSEGGTASWDLNDYKGNRVKGGVYLILIISSNGDQKLAGKLAVID
ncbi:PorZ beta-propeller-like domain-containing protein [Dyadobacter psychrotolerans]|uniref:PorZ beta-propeller-like domain-containing protein n=1 Tax=Dyadobacter psychrotolerans TaxID=2541721 RepID=UPI00140435D2|nr:two-component regulator propeller domain-containing protein [Dyadobacter psychrotolerans]